MSSGLAVGVGTAVASAHLDDLATRLQRASAECGEIVVRLRPLRTGDSGARDADLADIERTLGGAHDRFDQLGTALHIAADWYTHTERAAAAVVELVAAQLAAVAGFIAVRLGVVLLPSLINAAITASAVWAVLPPALRDAAATAGADVAAGAVDRVMPTLSDPRMIEAIRAALSLVDDAALGALGVPPPLAAALGDSGAGVSGIDSAALAVLGLAALAGSSGTDPARVELVGADRRRGEGVVPSAPPNSLVDRVERIPDPSTPIAIERYPLAGGGWHFEVYIGGTDSHAPLGGDRPFDMASNIALIAEQESSSLQAVQAALAAAGATPGNSVVFTGYSQGGAIATALAESGQWATAGLVTVGAPTGGQPVQGTYPAVVIEHRDDLVPVLSGIRRESTAVIVRGDAPGDGATGDAALPAHELERYATTAAAADAHDNVALQAAVAALPTLAVTGERRVFTATRVPRTP